ncbi:MAG TPA: DUF2244 domain-containing protein [Casimicrobiaceae bacterium]|nr:DUF2244 domain-containing protein [Casimicrobiaceae bacterium]
MPAVSFPTPDIEPDLCVIARLPSSLSSRQRWLVFGTLASFSLAMAGGFVLVGAWPVLAYSVLELSALAAAFAYMQRRARDWERLTVAGDRVVVERCRGRVYERREWNRPWVQVVSKGESPRGGMLELRCAGESWNFGASLRTEERDRLARDLRRRIAGEPLRRVAGEVGIRQG